MVNWRALGRIDEQVLDMPIKTAQARWTGDFAKGQGTISFGDYEAEYSRASIFMGGEGTSPLAILGASLAGCFTGAVAAYLTRDGYSPERISTDAEVHVEPPDKGFTVSRIHLRAEIEIEGVDRAALLKYAERAKRECPVGQALSAIEITLEVVTAAESAMPYCPKCKYEYREGIEECPDCKVKLVIDLHDENRPKPIDSDLLEVASFQTTIDADMARVRLEGEGIESVVMDGVSPSLYAGFSLMNAGVRLMVREEDVERATKVLLHE